MLKLLCSMRIGVWKGCTALPTCQRVSEREAPARESIRHPSHDSGASLSTAPDTGFLLGSTSCTKTNPKGRSRLNFVNRRRYVRMYAPPEYGRTVVGRCQFDTHTHSFSFKLHHWHMGPLLLRDRLLTLPFCATQIFSPRLEEVNTVADETAGTVCSITMGFHSATTRDWVVIRLPALFVVGLHSHFALWAAMSRDSPGLQLFPVKF
jgi:hypothetical protein